MITPLVTREEMLAVGFPVVRHSRSIDPQGRDRGGVSYRHPTELAADTFGDAARAIMRRRS